MKFRARHAAALLVLSGTLTYIAFFVWISAVLP